MSYAKIKFKRGPINKVKDQYENKIVPCGAPIFTTDSNDLIIGNNNSDPSLFSPKKDIVFVTSKVVLGEQKSQIAFPYNGNVKKVSANINNDIVTTDDISFEIQCYQNGDWKTVSVATLLAKQTFVEVDMLSPFKVSKNDLFRLYVNKIVDNISTMSVIVSIDLTI